MSKATKFKWTERREEFCRQYIISLNGAEAARQAKYSEGQARKIAHELLQHTEIQDRITELKADRVERSRIDADYVLQRLIAIDQMDVLDIIYEDGSLKPISEWPVIWRQFISGMDVAEQFSGRGSEREVVGMLKKIKWPDKIKNLELIGKHMRVQAFKDKVDVVGNLKLSHEQALQELE